MKRLARVGLVVLPGLTASAAYVGNLAHALEPGPDDVLVRVFDSGSGTCTVTVVGPDKPCQLILLKI